MQGTTWTAEVESVRNACGKKSQIVPKSKMKGSHRFNQVAMRDQVMNQVSIGACSCPQPNVSRKAERIIACRLQGLPAALHENALLRIHEFGFSRGNAKKMRVEIFDTVQNCSSFYVPWVLQQP